MTDDELIAISNPEVMAQAWRDFILFAWGESEFRAAFTADTGTTIPAATSTMEALIDDATGRTDDVLRKFVHWVTVNRWGLDYAPEAYRDSVVEETP